MKKTLFVCIIAIASIFFTCSVNTLFAQEIVTKISNGEIEEVKALLAKGVNPNTKIHNETILAISINGKFPEITTLLINAKGIKLNEWNILTQPERSWKYTALMKAVKFSDVVKQLLDKNVLIDLQDDWILWDGKLHESGGNTALMLAVGAPNFTYTESAKLLIDKGAKINIQNKLGYTALMLGVHNTEISKILIDKGADINAQDGNGTTPLMYAVQKMTPLKALIAKGADVNIQNKNGETALMHAVKGGLLKVILGGIPVVGGHMDAVKLLISKGADVNLQDTWGKTALMHAAGGVNALGNK